MQKECNTKQYVINIYSDMLQFNKNQKKEASLVKVKSNIKQFL
jgi:hypothetical protein